MPGKRSDDQVNITAWIDAALDKALHAGIRKSRSSKSQFIRDAIKEKLESLGFAVPDEVAGPPDRTRRYLALNESSGSDNFQIAQTGKKNMSGDYPRKPAQKKRPKI